MAKHKPTYDKKRVEKANAALREAAGDLLFKRGFTFGDPDMGGDVQVDDNAEVTLEENEREGWVTVRIYVKRE